jgi:hypothetical protein
MSFEVHVITAPEWGAMRKGPFQRTIPKFIVVHHIKERIARMMMVWWTHYQRSPEALACKV